MNRDGVSNTIPASDQRARVDAALKAFPKESVRRGIQQAVIWNKRGDN
jgi:hypothetical protein